MNGSQRSKVLVPGNEDAAEFQGKITVQVHLSHNKRAADSHPSSLPLPACHLSHSNSFPHSQLGHSTPRQYPAHPDTANQRHTTTKYHFSLTAMPVTPRTPPPPPTPRSATQGRQRWLALALRVARASRCPLALIPGWLTLALTD
ncbi:hypothetical protein E2C01_101360 [Portunus trituberculatus]|uniref:Uncharacterized protein n=1 Tax=Portunus trituberculatus TaxID=210409 RepID=A0A5B7KJX0_PORTR|nr:hypothetical protein [Portunus trituberculatus]